MKQPWTRLWNASLDQATKRLKADKSVDTSLYCFFNQFEGNSPCPSFAPYQTVSFFPSSSSLVLIFIIFHTLFVLAEKIQRLRRKPASCALISLNTTFSLRGLSLWSVTHFPFSLFLPLNVGEEKRKEKSRRRIGLKIFHVKYGELQIF